jgi:hypothetical protein
MKTLTQSGTTITADRRHRTGHHVLLSVVGAALALGVAYIHVKDQGGFPGDKSPAYIAIGYYLLEATGLVAAIALLVASTRQRRSVWALTFGVALGPLVGFVASRGPGLPMYTEDRGNWTEQLGIVSVVVEATLLVLAAVMVGRSRRSSD